MSAYWPLTEMFRLRLTMQSDWHVGSGTGRPGDIDRLVVRDADGVPFVPAKTLRGIWRDACERLALGLDDGKVGDWCSLVDRIFGSQPALGNKDDQGRCLDPTGYHDPAKNPDARPLASGLTTRPARLAVALRSRIKAERRFGEAMTFVKPGIKIDRRRGQAEANCLRFDEMARVGTVLEAECAFSNNIKGELRAATSALLVAASQLVERLGGKRRRGSGRCKFEVVGANSATAIAWLETHEKPPKWDDEPGDMSSSVANSEAAPAHDTWVVVPLVLGLTGPLAISHRTIGNVVETLDFLPGSYLLPHVTRTLKDLIDVRPAIRNGDLCVLPATLEIDGARGRPVPMALFHDKEDKSSIVNRLLAGASKGRQLKQFRVGYVGGQNGAAFHTIPRIVQTHNTVQDGPQRPTTEVGGVYTYEAIASVDSKAGPIRLRSELRLRKSLADRLPTEWTAKLNGDISLGRSKKDDYGAVKLVAEAPRDFSSPIACADELFVWLLSDVLLRDQNLRPAPTPEMLATELSRRLGVVVKVRNTQDDRAVETKPLDELVRVRRLDTWHVGWGLPRPSLVAMQAGSCVALTLEGKIEPAHLCEIEASGIGERTAEGYGQIRFNDSLLCMPPQPWEKHNVAESTDKTGYASPIESAYVEYARRLEREVWKQEIRRTALQIAAKRSSRQDALYWDVRDDKPSMSQLGALRGQLARLRGEADVPSIVSWLDHLARNTRRNNKWPNGAIDRVRELLEQRERVWNMIGCESWPTLTERAATQLRKELWPLAVRTLFDACMRAHKRELEST